MLGASPGTWAYGPLASLKEGLAWVLVDTPPSWNVPYAVASTPSMASGACALAEALFLPATTSTGSDGKCLGTFSPVGGVLCVAIGCYCAAQGLSAHSMQGV